ncbi:MAG: hypothetical protein ACLT4C_10610 [Butyricicoccus sp.]
MPSDGWRRHQSAAADRRTWRLHGTVAELSAGVHGESLGLAGAMSCPAR